MFIPTPYFWKTSINSVSNLQASLNAYRYFSRCLTSSKGRSETFFQAKGLSTPLVKLDGSGEIFSMGEAGTINIKTASVWFPKQNAK
jgi:hypothetical protein